LQHCHSGKRSFLPYVAEEEATVNYSNVEKEENPFIFMMLKGSESRRQQGELQHRGTLRDCSLYL